MRASLPRLLALGAPLALALTACPLTGCEAPAAAGFEACAVPRGAHPCREGACAVGGATFRERGLLFTENDGIGLSLGPGGVSYLVGDYDPSTSSSSASELAGFFNGGEILHLDQLMRGRRRGYLARLGEGGAPVWIRAFADPDNEATVEPSSAAAALALPDGGAVVGGQIGFAMDPPSEHTLRPYLAAYAEDGARGWILSFDETITRRGWAADDRISALALTPEGEVVAAGRISGPNRVEGRDLDTEGGHDLIVMRIRPGDGSLVWLTELEGVEADLRVDLWLDDLSVSPSGAIAFTGRGRGAVRFAGAGAGLGATLGDPSGAEDRVGAFVAGLTADGSPLFLHAIEGAIEGGGISAPHPSVAPAVTADPAGGWIVALHAEGPAAFQGERLTSALARLDEAGALRGLTGHPRRIVPGGLRSPPGGVLVALVEEAYGGCGRSFGDAYALRGISLDDERILWDRPIRAEHLFSLATGAPGQIAVAGLAQGPVELEALTVGASLEDRWAGFALFMDVSGGR